MRPGLFHIDIRKAQGKRHYSDEYDRTVSGVLPPRVAKGSHRILSNFQLSRLDSRTCTHTGRSKKTILLCSQTSRQRSDTEDMLKRVGQLFQ